MVGVGDEIEPRARCEKSGNIAELNCTGRIEVTLPAAGEWPRVAISVELAGCAAEHGPIFLVTQSGVAGIGMFKFVIGLDHEIRQKVWTVVILYQASVGCVISVSGIQIEHGIPICVIERTADVIIEFGRVQVVGVSVFDAEGNGADDDVVASVAPTLKIVAAHPDDVREILVAIAEELTVSAAFVSAVVEHDAEETAGFGGIEE